MRKIKEKPQPQSTQTLHGQPSAGGSSCAGALRPAVAAAVLAAALGCLVAGYVAGRAQWSLKKPPLTPELLATTADRAVPLKPGPWGHLEAVPIRIAPLEEYLPVKMLEEIGSRWYFVDYSPETLTALFNKADLTPAQRAELADTAKWQQGGDGITITPSDNLIFTLSPSARKTIYTALWQLPASGLRGRMASFRADQFDDIFAHSGLSADIIDLVKTLSFRHGQLLFFCDAPWVLGKIPVFDDKVRFIRTIVGKSTLLLRLHVTADSNVTSLANYWSKASWGKDITPMLESLSRVPGGARVDIVHLFPPMPTECLYTFPFPSRDPADALKDCHWVALNFFRDPPDLSLTDHEKIRKIIDNDYFPVLSDPRYGDLVQLVRPNGDVIHSAIFIADDVVYTKNSSGSLEPYMLMRLQTLIDTFDAFVPEDETLRVVISRSKYY